MNNSGFKHVKRWVAVAFALALSTPAFAHPGEEHTHGLMDGLTHPLTGLDHFAAILGIGLLTSLARAKVRWDIPLSFLLFMGLGAIMGLGHPIAAVELGVAVSVMCVGIWVLALHRGMQRWALPIAGAFGFLHGWAHGAGVSSGESGLLFVAGALAATLLLSGAGAMLGARLASLPIMRRFTGGAILLAGIGALAG